jgi:hypothetical protein
MTPDQPEPLQQIEQALRTPYWHHADFWINAAIGAAGAIIGAVGLYYAIKAFRAARAAQRAAMDAKTAADQAGRFMTMQTVAIELMGISQRLNNLDQKIRFREARFLLDEVTGKIHRFTAPFLNNPELAPSITRIHETLISTKNALSGVIPSPGEEEVEGQTYNAIQGETATLNLYVNDLLGLLEVKSHQQLAI